MFFLIDWFTRLLYGSEAVENFNRKQRTPKHVEIDAAHNSGESDQPVEPVKGRESCSE